MDSQHMTTQFMITIYSINLTVKFPCKMSIHYDGRPFSTEVQSKSGTFTFNQDLKIKIKTFEEAQVSAYLGTGNNRSILAGTLNLSSTMLENREGDRFTLGLQKCLDGSAQCSLKVNHLWKTKNSTTNLAKSSVGGVRKSPDHKKHQKSIHFEQGVETKSQYQANPLKKTAPIGNTGKDLFYRPQYQKYQKIEKQKIKQNFNHSDYFKERNEEFNDNKTYDRNKKRRNDETQNNLKLDIMKQKSKNEELERTVLERNRTIKELKDQILDLERKKLEKQYLQEELSAKENTIKILEDRISSTTLQNNAFRQTITQNQKVISEVKDKIRFDILQNKQDFQKKEHQLKLQLNTLKNKINELEMDNNNKNVQIVKAKKYIEDLESAAQQKIFQHDQLIQNLKKQHNLLIKESNRKFLDMEEKYQKLKQKMQLKGIEVTKLKESISVKQEQIRSLEIRLSGIQSQKTELLPFKSDFQTLSKRYVILEETFKEQQKSYDKNISSKNKEIEDIEKDNIKNIHNIQTKLHASHDKTKQLKNKVSELQNNVLHNKNEQQKYKKTIQKLEKLNASYTFKISKLEDELKASENKVQILDRDVHEIKNSTNHTQSLIKIQIQHSKESIANLTSEVNSLEVKSSKLSSSLQTEKSDKIKLQNKIQLLEDSTARTAEYIKEKKIEFEEKSKEYQQSIRNLNKAVKQLQQAQKQKQKEINNWQIVDLNYKNKIQNFEKLHKDNGEKIQKLQKVQIPKLNEQKKQLVTELQEYKDRLRDSLEQNKYIINERTKLESQTNKNNKINTVLGEEKLAIMAELNKVKNTLQRAQKKEESLNNEVKNLNEELKKVILKYETAHKQNAKNKEMVADCMNDIYNASKRTRDREYHGFYQKDHLHSTRSLVENLNRSRLNSQSESYDIRRMIQTIQSSSKQQQNMIIALEDTNRQYRDTINRLQTQINSLSIIGRQNDQKNTQTVERMAEEIREFHDRLMSSTQDYQDRISRLQTQLSKKEKDVRLQNQKYTNLRYELENTKKKFQMTVNDSESQETKLQDHIQQLLSEISFHEITVKNLEQQKKKIEFKSFEMQEQLNCEREQLLKRQRYLRQMTQKYTKIHKQHEELLNLKKQNQETIMTIKEQLTTLKEQKTKIKYMLKDEEQSKRKLQQFVNSVIKQKEIIVKSQLEKSSRVYELESQVLELNSVIESQQSKLNQKQENLSSLKNTVKEQTNSIKDLQFLLNEQKGRVSNTNSKVHQKEKKITQLQNSKQNIQKQNQDLSQRLKRQTNSLKQQLEELSKVSSFSQNQKQEKIKSLFEVISDNEQKIEKQAKQISLYEENVFFQRQKVSLSESTISQLKKQLQKYEIELSKYERQSKVLNEEATIKEEKLFEYSGMLFQMEQKLEVKQNETLIILQKSQNNWKYKLDEICEEYEQKLESMEKEKYYFKNKLQESQLQKVKLVQAIKEAEEGFIKELANAQQKQKEYEAQKILKIGEKNKEAEKYREQINKLNNTLKCIRMENKKIQYELTLKEEAITKLEHKIEQSDKVSLQLQKSYETQINKYKGKQLGFKNYKDQIKNSQWEVERQVKKICQLFIQKVVGCFPEGKEKLSEPIKHFQHSMSNAVNFKL